MDPLRAYPPDLVQRGLERWSWIGLDGLAPHSGSLFGDQFLVGRGSIWWLDMLDGTLTEAFASRDEMVSALASAEGLDRYLLGGLAEGAHNHGLTLAPDEAYAWRIPPVLGGETSLDNLLVLKLVVWMTIMGDVHRQAKDKPDGAPIAALSVDGAIPGAPRRRSFPWRR